MCVVNSELSDSRSDDDSKRKSVESLPSQRNVRLSIRPFDDSDDMTTSHHDEVSFDTETPMYSSGSVVWKSSSEAILDGETQRQQRGSATDSGSSEHVPDADGRRVSERGMASSESSDVILSSDCSVSSEQSPVHQTDRSDQQSTNPPTAAVTTHVDPPVRYTEIITCTRSSLDENISVTTRTCESEIVPDGTGCSDGREGSGGLLEEINDHLRQTHGRQLLPASVREMSANAGRRSLDDTSLVDIDTALAEVMSGLELLGRSRGLSLDQSSVEASRQPTASVSSTSSSPLGRVASPHTPDLVIGLPQFATGVQSVMSPRPLDVARSPPATGQLSSAEMFANVDRCTIKKSATSTSAPSSAEIWTSSGHPLRVVDSQSQPPSASSIGGGMVSVSELPGWSPLRSFGDCGGGGVRTRGSPARSQSCRAAERQSDQTWSTLWTTSTEIQRDREFVRNIVPQFNTVAHQPPPLSPSSPSREHSLSFDRAELSRFASSASADTGSRKDPATLTHSFIATLPRDVAGGPKTPVKMKPPVMKKPARSAEMMRRLSEYQQQVTDSACSGLQK